MVKFKVGEETEFEAIYNATFNPDDVVDVVFAPISGNDDDTDDFSAYPTVSTTLVEKGCKTALFRVTLPDPFSNDGLHSVVMRDSNGDSLYLFSAEVIGNQGINQYITRL